MHGTARRWTSLAVACGLVSLSAVGIASSASGVTGGPVTAQQSRAMLRPTDVSPDYGHVTALSTEDLGKGRYPVSCENPLDGRTASPKKAARLGLLKQIGFPAGIEWQNTVFYYASASQASTAWHELLKETLAYCNMSKIINIGTDGDVAMARVTLKAVALPTIDGVERVGIHYWVSLTKTDAVSPMYQDSYDYSVYAFTSNLITRVGVVQGATLETVEVTDAQEAAVKVAKRVAKLGR